MNYLQLHYFVELVRTGSFSKTADKLSISKAALSLSIGKLEKELGYFLLEHYKRQIKLTPYGEIFFDFCLNILNEVNDINLEFQEMKGLYYNKEVRLGISDSQYYADWLCDIYDIYPDMKLNILQMTYDQIQHNLLNGSIDFGIISGPEIRPALNRCLLTSQPYELLLLETHPLANRTTIGADLLSEIPLIALSPSATHNRMVDILSKELKFKPNIVFEGAHSLIVDYFHQALGGIITCAHDKRQYMKYESGKYRSLEILGTYSRYDFYLQWESHRYYSQYNQLFKEFVLKYYHLM